MYTRLNQLKVSLSYSGTLQAVTEVSKLHKEPLQQWIAEEIPFKFVGDNVDQRKGVRDIRADHRAELQHMYSMFVVRSRVLSLSNSGPFANPSGIHSCLSFLPTGEDVAAIRENLVILVGCIICQYMKPLSFLSEVIPAHISHQYSEEMAQKSEVVVLDILMKNETKNADMLDIMQSMQGYLGTNFPPNQKVLSGGDQLTCERQRGAKRHVMDGNTTSDRLDEFEPQTEDWHAMFPWGK